MSKRNHTYSLSLQHISDKNGSPVEGAAIGITFENHDNILEIVRLMEESHLLEGSNDTVELAIGMKMFGEVILRNRNHPLFSEMMPAFADFMKKLKTEVAKK